ncbi:uncharacterized protein Z518_07951 [Rhinocladiella mackenziei CBS 650.93]|uniref:protein-tyrosine-phosphatase n=1 Tax=Rhinocladiella mackenziei CBS 650.93 TaxID=1442369 RepID=A0A0D2FJB4_9EURO|nr:uncharacterized protein Z518_07951 [Rhinocladiella mackenziei CBS 650.93]KIX02012.1 hypothetical protein Z518_07951 [Rhinocladiella mackenziei CBS 650.93]
MVQEFADSADTHHRKRSFDLANNYQNVTTLRRSIRHGQPSSVLSVDCPEADPAAPSTKRRPVFQKYSNMPVEVGSIMSTPFPSFMSVVGQADASIAKDMEDLPQADSIHSDTQILVTDAKPPPERSQRSAQSLHHRDSVTSITTSSTESSPTTTNSTFDSPLITDSSPSSSPESATSNPPVSPFRTIMVKSSLDQTHNYPQQRFLPTEIIHGPPARPGAAIVDSSKNVKNLSLNMSAVILPRPATSHGFETSQAFSAPTSPMKDTPRTGRKKPTNLTIRTPGFQQLTFNRALDVPPTPSSRPSLHHMQSSPALASLASPTKPPAQGLYLHLPASGTIHSGPGSESSNSNQSGTSALPELKEEDEFHPQRSQETQERGYHKGPILIYESGVYLYLEPTAEEASKFDTVINVAKEIRCPFESDDSKREIQEPQTAISEMSFKSAWEWPQPNEIPTPTTPRQSSFQPKTQPEYLHVPWDHNSEILEDLYSLCRLIDERIQTGKRVLIHCQLGVSRSASLVIAYGLFKGYQPDFHSMYMSVKQRSQWVGPNMSLIYQLTDFRAKVVKGVYGEHSYHPSPSWWKIRPSSPPVTDTPIAKQSSWQPVELDNDKAKTSAAAGKAVSPPSTKPLPPLRLNKALPPVPLFPKNEQIHTIATPVKLSQILGGIAMQGPRQETKTEPEIAIESQSQSVSPRPLPFREHFDVEAPSQSPPNPSKTPKLGLVTNSPKMDLAMQDIPETPSAFSPRATEFMASPFGIKAAGDLAVIGHGKRPTKGLLLPRQTFSSTFNAAGDQIPTPFDPRSPHQQGEAPEILRNIDEFL